MRSFFRRRGGILIAVVAVILVLGGISIAAERGDNAANATFIRSVMRLVEKKYITPVEPDRLVNGALKGMLANLDPHSSYLDEAEYRQLMENSRGEFGGIGIELAPRGGAPTVIAPIDGTPAARAGILPGDVITEIDGFATRNMDFEDLVRRIRGKIGTTITLQIARQGKAPFDVMLTRSPIHIDSVKSHLETGRIGYVRVSAFLDQTPDDFTAALDAMTRRAGGQLSGLVLDLRNDPGGLLNAAISIAGDFLDGGVVVTTRGRQSEDDHSYDAPSDGDRMRGVPMVVLINGASASASEIVAGALQDHHRATIMGTRSFGKGSVQTIIPLSGHGALRLTTARYYTPSGRSIQDFGIEPNMVVSLPADEQVPNALLTREANLPGRLGNTGSLEATKGAAPAANPDVAGAKEAPIKPAIMGTSRDHQLSAALKYLRGMAGGKPPHSRG